MEELRRSEMGCSLQSKGLFTRVGRTYVFPSGDGAGNRWPSGLSGLDE